MHESLSLNAHNLDICVGKRHKEELFFCGIVCYVNDSLSTLKVHTQNSSKLDRKKGKMLKTACNDDDDDGIYFSSLLHKFQFDRSY